MPNYTDLIVEEVDGVCVEFERQSLQEWNVIRQHLFIWKIQLQYNEWINVIVGEKVVCWKVAYGGIIMTRQWNNTLTYGSLIANVLK